MGVGEGGGVGGWVGGGSKRSRSRIGRCLVWRISSRRLFQSHSRLIGSGDILRVIHTDLCLIMTQQNEFVEHWSSSPCVQGAPHPTTYQVSSSKIEAPDASRPLSSLLSWSLCKLHADFPTLHGYLSRVIFFLPSVCQEDVCLIFARLCFNTELMKSWLTVTTPRSSKRCTKTWLLHTSIPQNRIPASTQVDVMAY